MSVRSMVMTWRTTGVSVTTDAGMTTMARPTRSPRVMVSFLQRESGGNASERVWCKDTVRVCATMSTGSEIARDAVRIRLFGNERSATGVKSDAPSRRWRVITELVTGGRQVGRLLVLVPFEGRPQLAAFHLKLE